MLPFLFYRHSLTRSLAHSIGHPLQIRTLRPSLAAHSLRFIHSGRLLTDGILLLPWLRSLETRLTRQAEGLGGVIRGLAEEGEEAVVGIGLGHDPAAGAGALSGTGKGKQREEKVWLHCVVGGVVKESITAQEAAQDEDDSVRTGARARAAWNTSYR
jgi:hypothetical protein